MRRALARRLEAARAAARTLRRDPRVALHKVAEAGRLRRRACPRTRSPCASRAGASARPSSSRTAPTARCGSSTASWSASGADEEQREPIAAEVDAVAPSALGDFYGFACSVLEQLRADEADARSLPASSSGRSTSTSRFELGPESAGRRANFGASPGDEDHDEPYLYVGPWTADVSGELWNATGFNGAELTYAELLEAGTSDGRRSTSWTSAIAFCRRPRVR